MSESMKINPIPTDEEAAAIAAAIVTSWPTAGPADPVGSTPTGWRFSGRWWHRRQAWRG